MRRRAAAYDDDDMYDYDDYDDEEDDWEAREAVLPILYFSLTEQCATEERTHRQLSVKQMYCCVVAIGCTSFLFAFVHISLLFHTCAKCVL